jgi:hypothetical protein
MVPAWSWLDNICTTLAYGVLPCSYSTLMRLRAFPSACRALAEELVPSPRVRETAWLARPPSPRSCAGLGVAFRVGSPAQAATGFRPAGRRRVLCAMRAPCSCIHQRTIAQVSRAFCAILAQNVGIVRKTCRAEGKSTTSVSLSVCRGSLLICGSIARTMQGLSILPTQSR